MPMEDAVQEAIEAGEVTPANEQPSDDRVEVQIPGPDGNPVPLMLYKPTVEQLAWISSAARAGTDLQTQMTRLVDLTQDLMDPVDYERIWSRLRNRQDPLGLDVIMSAVNDLLEKVQDFPTQPLPGSSPASRAPKTGQRSTGRAPGKGSTRSS